MSTSAIENEKCTACQKNKAIYQCSGCGCGVCKSCVEFVQKEQFLFAEPAPIDVGDGTFCGNCFDSKVAPALATYEAMVEKAKDVFVFYKEESKVTSYFKRGKFPVEVEGLEDKESVVMKLAYIAASTGCNVIIETNVKSDKGRKGAYQSSVWSGSAFPVQVDPRKLKK
jgi:hypothetical protein